MEPIATLSDANCPTVVPVTFKRDLRSRNTNYWARLRGGVLQYRLKYRNADLGTSSKAPRFCLKHTLHQYRACPHGAMGLSRPGLSGFFKRLWVTGYAISSCRGNFARSVIARHGAPLRSICLISTNASAATCCILLNAKAYVSNSILAINTATHAPHGASLQCVR